MGTLREHIPAVVLSVSALGLAGGAAANIESSHVDVDHARVTALENQENQINDELTAKFPEAEALYTAGHITLDQSRQLGVTSLWFSLQDQLTTTQAELASASKGNEVLHGFGWLGMIVGGIGAVGSLMSLKVTSEMKANKLARDTREVRDSLKEDSDLEGKVFGLETTVRNIPKIDLEATRLEIFTAKEATQGLIMFYKKETDEGRATSIYEVLRGVADKDKFDLETIALLQPLFGAKINELHGGYDASDLGKRLQTMIQQLTEATALGMDRRQRESDEASSTRSLHAPVVMRVLDILLPLDQEATSNPTCEVSSEEGNAEFGRHWTDYVTVQARRLNAKKEQVTA